MSNVYSTIQSGAEIPSNKTKGEINSLYLDTTTGKMYHCTDINYAWEPVAEDYCEVDWNK